MPRRATRRRPGCASSGSIWEWRFPWCAPRVPTYAWCWKRHWAMSCCTRVRPTVLKLWRVHAALFIDSGSAPPFVPRSIHMSKFGIAALTAAVAVSLGGAGLAQAQDTRTVRIAYPPAWSAVEAAIPFGDTLGFFAEEGLDLEYVSIQGSGVLIPQLANGSIEFGIATPDLAVIAAAKGEPFPVKYFYN